MLLSSRRSGSRTAGGNDRRRAAVGRALRAAALALAQLLGLGAAVADPVPAPPVDPGAAPQAEQQPISQAETLLFMTNHLKELQTPSRLHYAFRKRGTLEQGFSDTVDLDVTSEADGSRKGTSRFFSGKRKIKYPDVDHAEGNPVLMYYLERDIREMSRLTGGRPDYFKKRIRVALAGAAQINEVDIKLDGRTLHAQQVTISPYESDPMSDRFKGLVGKRYVFVLCDAVPGGVYKIEGVVAAASGSSKEEPVIDETLTFRSAGKPQ